MDHANAYSLRSRRVVTPDGERAVTIHVEAGVIAGIGPFESDGEDLGDLVVLPGLIDPHVHCNEPGRTDWEGFATATRAAAAGGITLIADMPLNSSPVTTTVDALHEKQAAAAGKLSIDVAFHGGLVQGNADEIPALVEAGVVGIKAFLCHSGLDEFPNARPDDLRQAMRYLATTDVPLLAHAELVHDVPAMTNPRRYRDFIATRPRSFERDAIELLLRLSAKLGTLVHIVHLADAESLDILDTARRHGMGVTVETCPHYLYFDPQTIEDGATQFKCAPPIRGDGDTLLAALKDGRIDMIASDHSPCPPQMKDTDGRFDTAWGGISSLQLGLSIVRSLDGVTPAHVARWMSAAPAELLGVEGSRGTIEPGKRADLAVVDWNASWTVDPVKLQHRHPITPYAGCALRGVVRRTYLAGACVYDDGDFAPPRGRMVTRHG